MEESDIEEVIIYLPVRSQVAPSYHWVAMELTSKMGMTGIDRFYLGYHFLGSLKATILLLNGWLYFYRFVIHDTTVPETSIFTGTFMYIFGLFAIITFYIYDIIVISHCKLNDNNGNVMIGCPE